ncbi:MAG: hypothetical protein AVDCRST_MAG35-2009 [uncultured Quadrisphaera sp.]|uniref:Uncharacterized protein n=1 Tax=uncultured Quadrisphaera sp. TaxID=904978 RepID=A0A6J4PW96_9ACTN|nr:MAG: hypothetical protein AVDCRST_MAG35-2009 [uncultured Quadrisphaera sp.]
MPDRHDPAQRLGPRRSAPGAPQPLVLLRCRCSSGPAPRRSGA